MNEQTYNSLICKPRLIKQRLRNFDLVIKKACRTINPADIYFRQQTLLETVTCICIQGIICNVFWPIASSVLFLNMHYEGRTKRKHLKWRCQSKDFVFIPGLKNICYFKVVYDYFRSEKVQNYIFSFKSMKDFMLLYSSIFYTIRGISDLTLILTLLFTNKRNF